MDTNQSAKTSTFATKEENEHLAALEQEKARLDNAVKHLERSNAELAEALAAGPDRDFEEAVKENTRVLSDYQHKIYKLAVEIAGIKGEVATVTPSPFLHRARFGPRGYPREPRPVALIASVRHGRPQPCGARQGETLQFRRFAEAARRRGERRETGASLANLLLIPPLHAR